MPDELPPQQLSRRDFLQGSAKKVAGVVAAAALPPVNQATQPEQTDTEYIHLTEEDLFKTEDIALFRNIYPGRFHPNLNLMGLAMNFSKFFRSQYIYNGLLNGTVPINPHNVKVGLYQLDEQGRYIGIGTPFLSGRENNEEINPLTIPDNTLGLQCSMQEQARNLTAGRSNIDLSPGVLIVPIVSDQLTREQFDQVIGNYQMGIIVNPDRFKPGSEIIAEVKILVGTKVYVIDAATNILSGRLNAVTIERKTKVDITEDDFPNINNVPGSNKYPDFSI